MISLPAPAKINLFLHITGRRPDGYHELQTLFQLIDLVDEVGIDVLPGPDIDFQGDDAGVSMDDNLVVKAARLLQAETGCQQGARLQLTKQIPTGAGLGGGSSDAATTLAGLNRLWQLNLPDDKLAQMGRQLGADVPVFLQGLTAWGEGIGERLTPVEMPETGYVVVYPNCHVSTVRVFTHPDLTRDSSVTTIRRFLSQGGRNDCENVVCGLYPEVAEALRWLGQWGPAKMTGTGSCVFLPVAHPETVAEMKVSAPDSWSIYQVKAVNTSPLKQALAAL